METIWKVFSCFVALLFLELCNGLPLDLDRSLPDGHTQLLTGLIAVLLTICGVVCLAGCLCCQRRNGFKEFRDSPVVISVASNLDHGHVNPIANNGGEFTIFTPLSPPHHNNNVFLANQQVITRAEEDFKNGDIDVTSWFDSNEKDFPRTRLKYIKEFGKGWFGRVVEGTAQGLDEEDDTIWTPVIVRILEATASSRQRVLFLHDAKIYRCPKHSNLLRLLGRSLESIPLLLLQEHLTQGDLKLYLRKQKPTREAFLTSELPLRWCHQLASAVKHLHDHNITHPDLAARNCQISQDLNLKLGDYGCSTSDYPEDYYHGTENVPVRWCAPECVLYTATTIQTKNVTMAGNIWSLGVCLWEIYECGEQPYSNLSDDEVVSQVLGPPNVRLPKPSFSVLYTDYVYKLMQLCWSAHELRPSISQIDLMLVDLVQVHKNSSSSHEDPPVSIQDFDDRWENFKPNDIVKKDNHFLQVIEPENDLTNITVLNMSMKTQPESKTLSASLHNLAGSFDNLLESGKTELSWANNSETEDLSFTNAIRDLDSALAAENITSSSDSSPKIKFKLGPMIKTAKSKSRDLLIQKSSSESETEDELWRKKIEKGVYTEKVRIKSRSVADLMILTHIDYSESDSETPLTSLDYSNLRNLNPRANPDSGKHLNPWGNPDANLRTNYKNVRYGPKQNLENSLTFGSEGNLLSVQDTFQQELKKLQEERRDSLLFVPDNSILTSSSETKKVLENLNSPANLEPQNQVFNVYNCAISSKYSPIHKTIEYTNETHKQQTTDLNQIINYNKVDLKKNQIQDGIDNYKEFDLSSKKNAYGEIDANCQKSKYFGVVDCDKTKKSQVLPDLVLNTIDKSNNIPKLSEIIENNIELMDYIILKYDDLDYVDDKNKINQVKNSGKIADVICHEKELIDDEGYDSKERLDTIEPHVNPQTDYLDLETQSEYGEKSNFPEDTTLNDKSTGRIDKTPIETITSTSNDSDKAHSNDTKRLSDAKSASFERKPQTNKNIRKLTSESSKDSLCDVNESDEGVKSEGSNFESSECLDENFGQHLIHEEILCEKLQKAESESIREREILKVENQSIPEDNLQTVKSDENKFICKEEVPKVEDQLIPKDNLQAVESDENKLICEEEKQKVENHSDQLFFEEDLQKVKSKGNQFICEKETRKVENPSHKLFFKEGLKKVNSEGSKLISKEDLTHFLIQKKPESDNLKSTSAQESQQYLNATNGDKQKLFTKEENHIQFIREEKLIPEDSERISSQKERFNDNLLSKEEEARKNSVCKDISKKFPKILSLQENLEFHVNDKLQKKESPVFCVNNKLFSEEFSKISNQDENLQFCMNEQLISEKSSKILNQEESPVFCVNNKLISKESSKISNQEESLDSSVNNKLISEESPKISTQEESLDVCVNDKLISEGTSKILHQEDFGLIENLSPKETLGIIVEAVNSAMLERIYENPDKTLITNVSCANNEENDETISNEKEEIIASKIVEGIKSEQIKSKESPAQEIILVKNIPEEEELKSLRNIPHIEKIKSLKNIPQKEIPDVSKEKIHLLGNIPQKGEIDSVRNVCDEETNSTQKESEEQISAIILAGDETNPKSIPIEEISSSLSDKFSENSAKTKESDENSELMKMKVSNISLLENPKQSTETKENDQKYESNESDKAGNEQSNSEKLIECQKITSNVQQVTVEGNDSTNKFKTEEVSPISSKAEVFKSAEDISSKAEISITKEDTSLKADMLKSIDDVSSKPELLISKPETSTKAGLLILEAETSAKTGLLILEEETSTKAELLSTNEDTFKLKDGNQKKEDAVKKTREFLSSEVRKYDCEHPKSKINFDLSNSQDECPNSSFVKTSQENTVILGASDDYSIDYYSGLKTTNCEELSANFVQKSNNPAMKYSLETWDNFLGRSFDEQREFDSEPQSMLFLENQERDEVCRGVFSDDRNKFLEEQQQKFGFLERAESEGAVLKNNEETVLNIEGNAGSVSFNEGLVLNNEENKDRLSEDEEEELLNTTFTVDDLNKTYDIIDESADNIVDLSDINVQMEDSMEEKQGYDNPGYWESENSGGWFLHPQSGGEDLSGQMDVSEDDSYVGFSMDDEIMAAIRNELLTKLPQAQRASAEQIEDGDGEYETTDRNEVFVRYNCYNTPLSPIPEESYSELLNSGQSTPHCTINTDLGDADDSDWSEPGLDPNSILDDDTHSPRIMESPHKGPLHRHTPSQDSCCSNDTLFNLEELQYTEKMLENQERTNQLEEILATERFNHKEKMMESQICKLDNQEDENSAELKTPTNEDLPKLAKKEDELESPNTKTLKKFAVDDGKLSIKAHEQFPKTEEKLSFIVRRNSEERTSLESFDLIVDSSLPSSTDNTTTRMLTQMEIHDEIERDCEDTKISLNKQDNEEANVLLKIEIKEEIKKCDENRIDRNSSDKDSEHMNQRINFRKADHLESIELDKNERIVFNKAVNEESNKNTEMGRIDFNEESNKNTEMKRIDFNEESNKKIGFDRGNNEENKQRFDEDDKQGLNEQIRKGNEDGSRWISFHKNEEKTLGLNEETDNNCRVQIDEESQIKKEDGDNTERNYEDTDKSKRTCEDKSERNYEDTDKSERSCEDQDKSKKNYKDTDKSESSCEAQDKNERNYEDADKSERSYEDPDTAEKNYEDEDKSEDEKYVSSEREFFLRIHPTMSLNISPNESLVFINNEKEGCFQETEKKDPVEIFCEDSSFAKSRTKRDVEENQHIFVKTGSVNNFEKENCLVEKTLRENSEGDNVLIKSSIGEHIKENGQKEDNSINIKKNTDEILEKESSVRTKDVEENTLKQNYFNQQYVKDTSDFINAEKLNYLVKGTKQEVEKRVLKSSPSNAVSPNVIFKSLSRNDIETTSKNQNAIFKSSARNDSETTLETQNVICKSLPRNDIEATSNSLKTDLLRETKEDHNDIEETPATDYDLLKSSTKIKIETPAEDYNLNSSTKIEIETETPAEDYNFLNSSTKTEIEETPAKDYDLLKSSMKIQIEEISAEKDYDILKSSMKIEVESQDYLFKSPAKKDVEDNSSSSETYLTVSDGYVVPPLNSPEDRPWKHIEASLTRCPPEIRNFEEKSFDLENRTLSSNSDDEDEIIEYENIGELKKDIGKGITKKEDVDEKKKEENVVMKKEAHSEEVMNRESVERTFAEMKKGGNSAEGHLEEIKKEGNAVITLDEVKKVANSVRTLEEMNSERNINVIRKDEQIEGNYEDIHQEEEMNDYENIRGINNCAKAKVIKTHKTIEDVNIGENLIEHIICEDIEEEFNEYETLEEINKCRNAEQMNQHRNLGDCPNIEDTNVYENIEEMNLKNSLASKTPDYVNAKIAKIGMSAIYANSEIKTYADAEIDKAKTVNAKIGKGKTYVNAEIGNQKPPTNSEIGKNEVYANVETGNRKTSAIGEGDVHMYANSELATSVNYANSEEIYENDDVFVEKSQIANAAEIYDCVNPETTSRKSSCAETIKLNPEYVNNIPTYVNDPNTKNSSSKSSQTAQYVNTQPEYENHTEIPIVYENMNYDVYIDLLNDDPEVEYDNIDGGGSVEDVYGPLTDIRFTGPGDSQMMTTSFSDSNDLGDEQDWDSGSDTRSSSSGEFIWKEGEHEASVKALHAAPQDAETQEIDNQHEEEDDSSSGSEEDCEGPEFVPSAWDKHLAPTKSALRSPEKTADGEPKKNRGVSFKKQKYHCVYEYPREPESPIVQSFDIWQEHPNNSIDWDVDRDTELFLPAASSDTEAFGESASSSTTQPQNHSNKQHRNLYQTSNVPDFIGSSIQDDDFYISSSAKPFDMFNTASSQFFPGRHCDWSELIKNNDNITPDSGVEDITPGSLSDSSSDYIRPSKQILPLKTLAQLVINNSKGTQTGNNEIGGLRHTRNRLKLDLPPSPSAFTKSFSLEPVLDVVNRQVPTFTTFGKSRFVVQQVDTPTDDDNTKNVSFEALPYKPLATNFYKPVNVYADDRNAHFFKDHDSLFFKDGDDHEVSRILKGDDLNSLTTHVYKDDHEHNAEKNRVEIVRGEASLLDSADEDSGIESCTLERKRVSGVPLK